MLKNWTRKTLLLAVATFAMLTFQVTTSFAQGQSPSASDATAKSKTSDSEVKKTLVRALDKIEAQNNLLKAKDDVIAAQDKALTEAEEAKEGYKKAYEKADFAVKKQSEATQIAEEGWKQSEKRIRELEQKYRKSDNKVKWIAVGAVAALVTVVLLK